MEYKLYISDENNVFHNITMNYIDKENAFESIIMSLALIMKHKLFIMCNFFFICCNICIKNNMIMMNIGNRLVNS